MSDVVFRDVPVRLRVPATSANLGPGFDAFGLALGVHDEVTVRVGGSGLRVDVRGEGADAVPRDETHLVVRALRAAFDRLGAQPDGLVVECVNRVPHGKGLGSSAAAICAGIVAARELALGEVEGGSGPLGDREVLALATEMEGHPDNVAACLYGGLTIAWTDREQPGLPGGPRVLRLTPAPEVRPVTLVPVTALATETARGLLPPTVPHADAAATATRAALLVEALTHRTDLLLAATEDRLHQQYRAPAMPESAALVAKLRAAGLPAVVSGAGPTVLVLATPESATVAFESVPEDWTARQLVVDTVGVRSVPVS